MDERPLEEETPQIDSTDIRAFVVIQTLGLCAALDAGAIAPRDAERWLFQGGMRDKLEAHGACGGCLGLVDLGAAVTADDDAATAAAIERLRRGALAVLSAAGRRAG